MEEIAGIEYVKDERGRVRSVSVDVEKHGTNEAFQDFLDGLEAESRKGEETISLEEFRYLTIQRFGHDL
jgi:hypothetical protein